MPDDHVNVLLLGKWDREEMTPVTTTVLERIPFGRLERSPEILKAVDEIRSSGWFPDLVIVCQNWPDEYSETDVARLFGTLPLARIICCYGAWCESDGRNRFIWPLAVRVPARCAASRIRREVEVLGGRHHVLPVTASRDEVFGFDTFDYEESRLQNQPAGYRLPIEVHSADRELRRWIIDLLKHRRFEVCDACDVRRAQSSVHVWDMDPWNERMAMRLDDFCTAHPNDSVIGLMGLANPDDRAVATRCGADSVIPKLGVSDLLPNAIRAVVSRRRSTARWNNPG